MEKIDLDKIYEKSNLKWLKSGTIFCTIHGSLAYGTAREGSDIDIRGIAIPPVREYNFGILDQFHQAIFNEPYDTTIFGLRKFVELSINANPNALEIIFTDPSDHLFVNDIGQSLLDIRDLFLSKKCRFSLGGYAMAQLKRINTHRSWLLRKDTIKKPERSDFGLADDKKSIPGEQILEIEAAIRKTVDEWNIDTTGMDDATSIKFKKELENKFIEMKLNTAEFDDYALRNIGLNDNLTAIFQKERAYRSAKREWAQYNEWKENRNKERFALEEKHMMDTKHASHLIRLYRECIELLETGKLNVKRPDAEELLFIRDGGWSYEKIIEHSEKYDKILDELYKTSKIPKEPDRIAINKWLISTTEEYLEKNK